MSRNPYVRKRKTKKMPKLNGYHFDMDNKYSRDVFSFSQASCSTQEKRPDDVLLWMWMQNKTKKIQSSFWRNDERKKKEFELFNMC